MFFLYYLARNLHEYFTKVVSGWFDYFELFLLRYLVIVLFSTSVDALFNNVLIDFKLACLILKAYCCSFTNERDIVTLIYSLKSSWSDLIIQSTKTSDFKKSHLKSQYEWVIILRHRMMLRLTLGFGDLGITHILMPWVELFSVSSKNYHNWKQ